MVGRFADSANPDAAPKQRALILSGGGALGAYQVGVLKALAEGHAHGQSQPFECDLLVGTSAGAFNATFLAAQGDVPFEVAVSRLETLWLSRIADRGRGNGVYRWLFEPLRRFINPLAPDFPWLWARLGLDTLSLAIHMLHRSLGGRHQGHVPFWIELDSRVDLSALVSIDPFRETLREELDFQALRSSPRRVLVTSTGWENLELKVFGNQALSDHEGLSLLCGAISIPGVFPPERFESTWLVDGSVIADTPLGVALTAGAESLCIISSISFGSMHLNRGTLHSIYQLLNISWRSEMMINLRNIAFLNSSSRFLEEFLAHSPDEEPSRQALMNYGAWLRQKLNVAKDPIDYCLYAPDYQLGNGLYSLLDFSLIRIKMLIEQGFEDTVTGKNIKENIVSPNFLVGPAPGIPP